MTKSPAADFGFFKKREINNPAKSQIVGVFFILSQIGPVGSVLFLCFPIRENRKRNSLDFFSRINLFNHFDDELFVKLHHFFSPRKAHFQIQLSEFWLAAAPRIFVTETTSNLKIFFRSGHHQKLFILLGALGQGKKFSRINPRRHNIISGSFRR